MSISLSRRTLVAATAGAAASAAIVTPKHSRVYAAPNIIRQTGSNVEVTFWFGLPGFVGERIKEVIADFNAQNNGVVVNALQLATYEETAQNLTLALQDGSYPDAVLLPEQLWFRFYLSQAFIPLDDLISKSGFDIADVVPSLAAEGQRNGQYYWLPLARSTSLMYYNKTLYDAAGIPGPAATYSQLREFGPALTDEGQQIYGMAFEPAAWYFQGVAWAFNGAFSTPDFEITFNQGGTVAAGQYYQTGVQEGWGYIPENTIDDFGNGYVATGFFSTGSLGALTEVATANGFEIGTAFMPSEVEGVTRTASTGGSGIGIMRGIPAERQEAAFAFYSFWASPETTISWAQNTGYMPVRTSAIESPEMQAFFAENPNYRVAVDQLGQRAAPSDPARRFLNTGQDHIDEALQEVMVNGSPVQEAFDAAADALAQDAAPVIEQLRALEGSATPTA